MVERDQRNHCHLCNKDCASPEYNPNRVTLNTTWHGEISLPAHFYDCPKLRELIDLSPNQVPMVTS